MFNPRSKLQAESIIKTMGLHPVMVGIGEIEIEEMLSSQKYKALKERLRNEDFELVMDKEIILVEKIRSLVIELIHHSDAIPPINYSDYISDQLNVNYTYLSRSFSKMKRMTIEHFIIAHKIERVKQLLLQNELTLSKIAKKLHYSSVAHLSAQFKKVTGITTSIFKKLEYKNLIPISDL